MRVTILGSGTCVPAPDRFPAGVLVEADGRTVLVDIGPGCLRKLPEFGVDLGDIDHVLFTHYHTDHCADLAPLLFALGSPRYVSRGPLAITGPRGLRDLQDGNGSIWGRWVNPSAFPWELREVGPDEPVDLGAGLTARGVSVEHTEVSLAWRIRDAAGAEVAISGDTKPCDGAVEAGRDVDLYVLECAFPDAVAEPYHLSPSTVGPIATAAAPGHLCLTHFYPECDEVDLAAEVAAAYDGPFSLATDGLAFLVSPGAAEEVR